MAKNWKITFAVTGDVEEDNRRVEVIKACMRLSAKFFAGDKLEIIGTEPVPNDPEASCLVLLWGCREDVPAAERRLRFEGIRNFLVGGFYMAGGDPAKVARLLASKASAKQDASPASGERATAA